MGEWCLRKLDEAYQKYVLSGESGMLVLYFQNGELCMRNFHDSF